MSSGFEQSIWFSPMTIVMIADIKFRFFMVGFKFSIIFHLQNFGFKEIISLDNVSNKKQNFY
jgi:hypothetical protein